MKDQLEELITQMVALGIDYEDAVGEFEKHFIRRVLENTKGNQFKAARELRIHRNTLRRKIEQFKLDQRPGPRKRGRH